MKITIPAALFFVSVIAAPAHAQQAPDARWAPWLGCWQLIDENQGDATLNPAEGRGAPSARRSRNDVSVCATRASEPAGITLKTLVSDQSALEQTIIADGAVHSIDDADCRGTQRAEWSRAGMRLFSSAELVCGNQQPRTISGLDLIAGSGVWVDVQVVGIPGRETVRVRRYRRAPDQRSAAVAFQFGTPLTLDDVKEASAKVSPRAVEAALVATSARFDLNSRRLIDLADARVPAPVIDLMIALSYPERFVVERTGAGGTGSFFDPYVGSLFSAEYPYSPYFYGSFYDLYDPYGAYFYTPFSYSYSGRGVIDYYLPGIGGVIAGGGAVTTPADNGGRVVNGVGYVRVRPREATADNTTDRPRQSGNAAAGGDSDSSGSFSGSSAGSSGGVSSGGFSSGSSSSDTGRTAEPR
jgi:uncharacterized membrane protein YgcG